MHPAIAYFQNVCTYVRARNANPFKAGHARACSNLRLSPVCGLYLTRAVLTVVAVSYGNTRVIARSDLKLFLL